MRAQQRTSVPQPLEDWAGVSVDGTVQYGGASLDDSLRHVSFSLQHRRLCRDKHHPRDENTWRSTPERACSTGLPLTRTKDSARMEPTLFSAMHTYVPASLEVTFSTISELLPASSTVAPGSSETLSHWDWPTGQHRPSVSFTTCLGTVVDGPRDDRRRRTLSVAG